VLTVLWTNLFKTGFVKSAGTGRGLVRPSTYISFSQDIQAHGSKQDATIIGKHLVIVFVKQ